MTFAQVEKFPKIAPLALALALPLALGACASAPPSGPTVSAIAGPNVSNRKFARDDSACRARAYAATVKAATIAGQFGLQDQYNSVYSNCMLDRGYTISETVTRYYYNPGPGFYGPDPFFYGGPVYYGWGWRGGWAGAWNGGGAWGHGWARRW
ncbi:hypothetical protein K9U39_11170 [Rhodoblastus acidophilus]|uniref:Lipoprotein n=1 Tax=Candidatus Rhodoblastus alkanivorans TaxID=2954117 RepID=A0ABS9ZC23_9HYPH|nr:hypothetical protein [Candidatus Rhodoblastus alkanivorans]MCI4678904.1 hypothetical protein [Candidatus Rhodoblastus alkanivorans]MCI4684172.1 hypothetical protein [Candidatus Rhodoblastus alkanivorans]MDI4641493.1 hypothetical protein [Rhodoblastus acidophilus]